MVTCQPFYRQLEFCSFSNLTLNSGKLLNGFSARIFISKLNKLVYIQREA